MCSQSVPVQHFLGNQVEMPGQQFTQPFQNIHQTPQRPDQFPEINHQSSSSYYHYHDHSDPHPGFSNHNSNEVIQWNPQTLPEETIANPPIMENGVDDTVSVEQLDEFAKMFKETRKRLGFTQIDVGMEMQKLYGYDISQTTISRFEVLNLSYSNMCYLKPLLQNWLEYAEKTENHPSAQITASQFNPETYIRRRKKRTIIEPPVRDALESAFTFNRRPSSEEISTLAETLAMEREVIQVWFSNRRQKEKRTNKQPSRVTMPIEMPHMPLLPQQNMFESQGWNSAYPAEEGFSTPLQAVAHHEWNYYETLPNQMHG